MDPIHIFVLVFLLFIFLFSVWYIINWFLEFKVDLSMKKNMADYYKTRSDYLNARSEYYKNLTNNEKK